MPDAEPAPGSVGNPELADFPRRYCPICGHVVRKEFGPGPGGRPDAACPRCRSLERHRFFAVLLSILDPLLQDLGVLLEVSPSPETSPLLAALRPRVHVRSDLGADPRKVDVYASLTQMPHADDAVDLLVCYHVLEHVPDDRTAMREIARVLAPGGLGIIQVPFRPGTRTDEDPDAPVAERVRRFGQADHVRYYGDDFEARLVDAGLSVQRLTPRSLLGTDASTWLHLSADEMVWLVRPTPGAVVPPPLDVSPTSLTRTLDAMLGEMARLRGDLVHHRSLVRELRGELAVARSTPAPTGVTRVVAGVRRRAARLRRRA